MRYGISECVKSEILLFQPGFKIRFSGFVGERFSSSSVERRAWCATVIVSDPNATLLRCVADRLQRLAQELRFK